MRVGRREEGGGGRWRERGRGKEGGVSDTPSTNALGVPLPAGSPGPLAPTAGPDPGSWPAPSIFGLPPLALGGASGHALSSSGCL